MLVIDWVEWIKSIKKRNFEFVQLGVKFGFISSVNKKTCHFFLRLLNIQDAEGVDVQLAKST